MDSIMMMGVDRAISEVIPTGYLSDTIVSCGESAVRFHSLPKSGKVRSALDRILWIAANEHRRIERLYVSVHAFHRLKLEAAATKP